MFLLTTLNSTHCTSFLFPAFHFTLHFQIIHLLTYLGKIWNGILPVDIYCQSLGCLFDDVLQRITWEILQLEVRVSFTLRF